MTAADYSAPGLLQVLELLPESNGYLVAYSGGMDSHVLLHSIVELKAQLPVTIRAIHVNHGISRHARTWSEHSRDVCESLRIDLEVVDIDARCPQGESPESWARHKRYTVLADRLAQGEVLLTAHHLDDQAETLLLQLFRGAGPDGLSAMPQTQKFGRGWHCRPLLEFARSELHSYALEHHLQWVEDESNQDIGVDRNYIRHQLVPKIKNHWPAMCTTLSRAAMHQAEAALLLDQLAALDLLNVAGEDPGAVLNVAGIKDLPLSRQKNMLRYWLRGLALPVPDTRHLHHIVNDVVNARHDAMPRVSWSGAEVRRYREHLYASQQSGGHDSDQIIIWDLEQQLHITHGKLIARLGKGKGIKAELCRDHKVEIHYRSGGETIQPAGRQHHHALKKLLQEHAVPPWLRNRIPLLYIDGKLAAVPGKWIDAFFTGTDNDDCWQISWEGIDEIFIGVRGEE